MNFTKESKTAEDPVGWRYRGRKGDGGDEVGGVTGGREGSVSLGSLVQGADVE